VDPGTGPNISSGIALESIRSLVCTGGGAAERAAGLLGPCPDDGAAWGWVSPPVVEDAPGPPAGTLSPSARSRSTLNNKTPQRGESCR